MARPTPERPLRAGLVGTGYWARTTHAPAIAATPGLDFVAIWGRNQDATQALAAHYEVAAHGDFDAFLSDVDMVVFSVPPDVQAELAVRAARAGKHLLLEKPVATSEPAILALSQAVQDAGVASVVFFILHFRAATRAWLADIARQSGWAGGSAVWLGSSQREFSPFNTPWRQDKGGLWDLGPHAISILWACLGPVRKVTADEGRDDVTHLILHHEGGASSTVTVTLRASEAAAGFGLFLWGEAGRSTAPDETGSAVPALSTALAELAANARSGEPNHPCDVRFGRDVCLVLAEAERQLAGRRDLGSGRQLEHGR